jgi:hypothetical protein
LASDSSVGRVWYGGCGGVCTHPLLDAASLRTDICQQRKESSSTSHARNPFNLNFFLFGSVSDGPEVALNWLFPDLIFFDSAQCLMVRRWRLIGYFLILYNPLLDRPSLPASCASPRAQITTVDKFQGQQNDYILLSLCRTRAVGHIRDVRRLVVATSRSRLGLYVFGRRELFENCYELAPTLKLLLARPDKLAIVPTETHPCTRALEDKARGAPPRRTRAAMRNGTSRVWHGATGKWSLNEAHLRGERVALGTGYTRVLEGLGGRRETAA